MLAFQGKSLMTLTNNYFMATSKRKIAFFSKDLDFGGIEKVFVDYANYLSHNNNVSFILCRKKGGLLSLLNSTITIHELQKEQLKQAFFSLVTFLRKNKFDVIISGSESCNILLVIANCFLLTRSKIITSQHSFSNADTSRFIHFFLLPWALGHSCCTICVSNGIKEMLLKMHLEPAKLKVLYNPINSKKIIELSKERSLDLGDYIVFVGRMYAVKNVPFLIRSFKLFQEKNPHFKLVLVGDGPELDQFKHYSDKTGIANCILWVGATSNPYPYIKNSTLLVLTSLSESLSNVVLEALCLGKTVVSTPCTGPVELLKAPTYGYVSDSFDNCEEFAALMEYAIEHQIPSDRLEAYSNSFDISCSGAELDSLINHLDT